MRIAPAKLRTTAKVWGQEPSGYTNKDYQLIVHGRDWMSLEVPVAYAETQNMEASFRYLGVHVDANNKYEKQYAMLMDMTKQAAEAAMHKQASPETINMAIKLSTHRKVAFPGKFGPWTNQELRQLDVPLDQLHKHHLRFLSSTHSAAIYMEPDVGGTGIPRLSDQINIDKWAMLTRGLHSDMQTARAAQSLLQRSLRIGRTDTDTGYEAIARPTHIPQLLRSLLEAMGEAGYSLRRAGLSTHNTPSQSVSELAYHLAPTIHTKMMNYRITTLADMMHFSAEGNNWDPDLCATFPLLAPLLPICPQGDRILRVGQFWATQHNEGHKGIVTEIMGLNGTSINGRMLQPDVGQGAGRRRGGHDRHQRPADLGAGDGLRLLRADRPEPLGAGRRQRPHRPGAGEVRRPALGRLQAPHEPDLLGDGAGAAQALSQADGRDSEGHELLLGPPGRLPRRPPAPRAADSRSTMGGWYAPQGLYLPRGAGRPDRRQVLRGRDGRGLRPAARCPTSRCTCTRSSARPTSTATASPPPSPSRSATCAGPRLAAGQRGGPRAGLLRPWFKHCRKKAIDQYVAAIRKVAANYQELSHLAHGGDVLVEHPRAVGVPEVGRPEHGAALGHGQAAGALAHVALACWRWPWACRGRRCRPCGRAGACAAGGWRCRPGRGSPRP